MLRFTLIFLIFYSFNCFSQDGGYWPEDRRVDSGRVKNYSASLHNQMNSIKGRYEENGEFYYSDVINSFGFRDVLNARQEMIFCGAGDVTFSDVIQNVAASGRQSGYVDLPSLPVGQSGWTNGVLHSSTTMGMPFQEFVSVVEGALINNASAQAKGRFCYDRFDSNVDYRRAGSEDEVYCDTTDIVPSYTDTVSGFSCQLNLDVPLKLGETRYVRQSQLNEATVAKGFLGCYSNPSSGAAELVLIDNPDSCSPSNRSGCVRTCDWAQDVVCEASDMPRWGPNNACGGYGTTVFKGDVIDVASSPQLSLSVSTGIVFEGRATMFCAVSGIGEARQANWQLLSGSTCSPLLN
jgi:hypothetical protein